MKNVFLDTKVHNGVGSAVHLIYFFLQPTGICGFKVIHY